MNRKKQLKTWIQIGALLGMILCCCILLSQGMASKAAGEVYIITDGLPGADSTVNPLTEYQFEKTGGKTFYLLKSDGGAPITTGSAATIKWSLDNNYVAEIESQDRFSVTVKPIGPGDVTLRAEYIENGQTVSFRTLSLKVPLQIDDSDTRNFYGLDGEDKAKSLILYKGEKLDLKLKGIEVNTEVLTFSTNKNTIIDISSGGAVTAKNVGSADITVSTVNSYQQNMSYTIKAYVLPRVKEVENDTFNTDISMSIGAGKTGVFAFDTDADDTSTLCWTITREYNGVKEEIVNSYKNTVDDRIYITPNGTTGYISGKANAGKYEITFYLRDLYSKYLGEDGKMPDMMKEYASVELTIIPDWPSVGYIVKNLAVGDIYNVYEAFNIAQTNASEYFQGEPAYVAPASEYITLTPATGDVEGIKATNTLETGEVDVKLALKEGVNISGSAVTVSGNAVNVKFRVIDGISLNSSVLELYVGATYKLAIVSASPSNEPIKWETGDKNVVTVDENGVVTAVKPGKTVVTATQKDTSGVRKKVKCTITVYNSVTNITLTPSKASIKVGENLIITAAYKPADVGNPDIKWVTSDPSIVALTDDASTNSISIQGVAPGTAVVAAVNKDNIVLGSCAVTVEQEITKLTLPQSDMTVLLSMGQIQLVAKYTPNTATATDLQWKSSNTKVATIDSSTGLVTLKKVGTTAITVTSVYNPSVTATCNLTVKQNATALYFDVTNKTIKVGESFRITYYFKPSDAAENSLTWTVLDKSIATVKDGVVTAKAPGSTHIMARTSNGATATCALTVTQDSTGVKLDTNALTLAVGEVYFSEATVTPNNSSNKKLTWSSSDKKVATVTDKGKITAVSPGKATITVKTATDKTATLEVTVEARVAGVYLNYKSKIITVKKTFQLTAVVEPKTASNQKVKWSSDDEKIATVSASGKVKGISGGTTLITCTTEEGDYTASCVVTVKEAVTSIKLNKTSATLTKGQRLQLQATVTSTYSTNQKVKWKSSKKKVATVNSKGKVIAKGVGKTLITCRATDGSGAEAECEITVIRQVSSIAVNKSLITLYEGETAKIAAKVTPANATHNKVKWSSSDKNVAVVDSTGRITAVKQGTATIKAAARDNSKKAAYCIVNVLPYVSSTSVITAQKELTMVIGEQATISATMTPANTTDSLRFVSDNMAIALVNSTTGLVTARTPGTARIVVTTTSGKQTTVDVTVVGLNFTSYTLEQYDSVQLRVEGVETGVTWDVADTSVAVVNNGRVTAKKAGTTNVYANVNGSRLTCRITVTDIR